MRSAIKAAQNSGYEFVMACNTRTAYTEQYKQDCEDYGITLRHIDFNRNPVNPKNLKAMRQLTSLLKTEHFDAVHCNTPIGGLAGRICSAKAGVKPVIYQVHGFHFWHGAPLINWMLYYPVEKSLSKRTDILITIARDDFELAKKMRAKTVKYVHGVGVDLSSFERRNDNERNLSLRMALGIPDDACVLLSVGELNKNKNHKVVINALNKLQRKDIFYVICGTGNKKEYLQSLISKYGLQNRVILPGFRTDVSEFYKMADLFVFPSLREGIPGAVMEAAATGVTVIASDIRGIRDIITDPGYRFSPTDADELSKLIERTLSRDNRDNQETNYSNLSPYSFDNVVKELEEIYKGLDQKIR
jgi:glycosyltransferase involved in cell wall biosynthesis